MPATRVLGTGLGALTDPNDYDTGDTTGGSDTTDTYTSPDDPIPREDTIQDPILDPIDQGSDPVISGAVQSYVDELSNLRNEIGSLRQKHSSKSWWSEFATRVTTMRSKLQSATTEALSIGAITRPGLPTRARSLIDSIETKATQAQNSGGSDGGGSNGGDTSNGGDSSSNGGNSSSDGSGKMTTTNAPEQTIAGFPVSQVKMVLTGGMLLGGAYFFLSEK